MQFQNPTTVIYSSRQEPTFSTGALAPTRTARTQLLTRNSKDRRYMILARRRAAGGGRPISICSVANITFAEVCSAKFQLPAPNDADAGYIYTARRAERFSFSFALCPFLPLLPAAVPDRRALPDVWKIANDTEKGNLERHSFPLSLSPSIVHRAY